MHTVTWWSWAIAISISLAISHNSWLAMVTVASVAFIVHRFKEESPWKNGFVLSLRFALALLLFRMLIAVTISVPMPGRTLFTLPVIPLPSWMVGIRLGGAVTLERITSTFNEVAILAAIIVIIGGVNTLTSPRKVLRALPYYFYELGLILVIATSLVPELFASFQRIRTAQRMRGMERPHLRRTLMPLLEDALERSLNLAQSMDSRGYGVSHRRSQYAPERFRRSDLVLLLLSSIAIIYPPFVIALSLAPLFVGSRRMAFA